MDDVWLLLRWLHIVAMAFFVGGQLVVAAAVVPVARRREDPDGLRAIARRFGYGSLVAVAVLLATGAAMASHFQRWSDGTLQLKLGLIALTGLLIGWHMRRPTAHALAAAVFVLSLVIVWLGLSLTHG
jgi:putative copper export protein